MLAALAGACGGWRGAQRTRNATYGAGTTTPWQVMAVLGPDDVSMPYTQSCFVPGVAGIVTVKPCRSPRP